jgi:ATP-dependent RNA helicase RhlE
MDMISLDFRPRMRSITRELNQDHTPILHESPHSREESNQVSQSQRRSASPRHAPVSTVAGAPGFAGLGIAPGLLAAISDLGFTDPTPIQLQAIPLGIEGADLVAIAQTGTGKTLGFGIPMLQRLAQIKGRGLVLLPTRELALQVDEALMSVGKKFGLKTAVLIGGAAMGPQLKALGKKPRIIIATPGRLLDHLQQRTMDLKDVKILVLDEADRMLDMGFAPQINRILAVVPSDRQTMLFSATMPSAIVNIARRYMKAPVNVEIAPSGTASENVAQEVFFVEKADKSALLEIQLKQYPGPTLVFTRTKHGAAQLARRLRAMNFSATDIHSNKSMPQRRKALEGFKSGQFRVLVATDIAARGIDVAGIEVVVNYDLPSTSEDYVHRIGRTARAGRAGRAISFASFNQTTDIRAIESLIRKQLPVMPLPAPFVPPPGSPKPGTAEPRAPRPDYGRGAQKRRSSRGRSRRPQRV